METLAKKKITKIEKYIKKKKMNSTSSTEHKTDMNITKINKYTKTEQHFYDGAQNRTQLHTLKPPRKKLMKIFNQQLRSIHYLYLEPKNQKNVKLYNKKIKRITK